MMKNKFFLFACIALFVAAVPLFASAKTATSIDTTPATATIKAGESITWIVTATYDDASTEDISNFATFNIPTAAKGSLSGNTYTSQTPGTYSIPVSVGSFSDTVSLTVVHGDPVSLELNASGTTIVAGEGNITFTGSLRDSVGNTWDATGQIALTSDDTEATINGVSYTSKKAGTWNVTASAGTFNASRQVTVTPSDPAKLIIPGELTRTLEVNKEVMLTAEVTDEFGNKVNDPITWSASSDHLTVNENGKITAKKVGEASVTASVGTLLASVKFTITEAPAGGTNQNANTNSSTNTNTSNNANTNENQGDETADESTDETCEAIAAWIPIVILLVYALILFGYYLLIRTENDGTWWIFPVLLTVIGIIVWNKYMCPGSIVWMPWVLGAIGLALTGYGRGTMMKKGNSSKSEPKTPDQNPMF